MTSNQFLLYQLAGIMLENEQQILPVDLLFDDERIGDFVKNIQIDSPYQQMLFEGILTELVKDQKLYVCFTVEGYFHYVLGEVIFNQAKGKDVIFLLEMLRNNHLNGVKEGVEQCLILDVKNGSLKRLIDLIDNEFENQTIVLLPLVHAFMKNPVRDIFQILMENPTLNDWKIIKQVRGILLDNQKQNIIVQLDGIIKESEELKNTITELLQSQNNNSFHEALTLISFYTDLNSLDQAKFYYTQFIEEAEKRNNRESLVVALEQLGDSEYKRSGRDGYLLAMDVLSRALEIRESESEPQKDKLKNTYRLLGSAYLSLGLQVVKSTNYFQKAKAIILEESSDSAELAEINLFIGLASFWRGLRGIGRWHHADPSLLVGLSFDLFEYADAQFQLAYNYKYKKLGKSHPQTLEAIHYLQENRYALGNYEKAIPWLKKYVDAIPYKTKEHTDNFYLYCLIVSLEEYANIISIKNRNQSLSLIDEAIYYAKSYDEKNQITYRLLKSRSFLELGEIKNSISNEVIETIEQEIENEYNGNWSKWKYAEKLEGFHTNNWMSDSSNVWFFNLDQKQLAFWEIESDTLGFLNPAEWPEGCSRFVLDPNSKTFFAWSSIQSTVFHLIAPYSSWSRLSYGAHDVNACGASFGFDPVNNYLYEFGGYGYFTKKNWIWAYDLTKFKWLQIKENKPGIAPYPREGQLLSIDNGEKAILLSGIGSDTGIQREHKARMGLGIATDVGYFTWLRDAYELDLKTMEWRTIMEPNHQSIRHEGAMGYINNLNLIINWAGIIPSAIFGTDSQKTQECSIWRLNSSYGFKSLIMAGEIMPEGGGYFISIPNSNKLIYKINSELFLLEII